jgi:hypothetical protein
MLVAHERQYAWSDPDHCRFYICFARSGEPVPLRWFINANVTRIKGKNIKFWIDPGLDSLALSTFQMQVSQLEWRKRMPAEAFGENQAEREYYCTKVKSRSEDSCGVWHWMHGGFNVALADHPDPFEDRFLHRALRDFLMWDASMLHSNLLLHYGESNSRHFQNVHRSNQYASLLQWRFFVQFALPEAIILHVSHSNLLSASADLSI